MHDKSTIKASSAQETRSAGVSLANSLYETPLTVALEGELGAGKTTFLQGFAEALGINEPLTSPTYALEQRYESARGPFLHLDLYRLSDAQAAEFLRSSDESDGIRCIEWSERAGHERLLKNGPVIRIRAEETTRDARTFTIEFHDAALPTEDDVRDWRKDAMLPAHIIDHCEAVATCADRLAEALQKNGRIVRPVALHTAARLHDLFRFLDFRPGGHPELKNDPAAEERWQQVRAQFPNQHHEEACATFLREKGFSVIASIVEPHGLSHVPRPRVTTEEKILFYADKRVMLDRIVTLDERFADFATRYGGGTITPEARRWRQEVDSVERDLFPSGVPF